MFYKIDLEYFRHDLKRTEEELEMEKISPS